MKAHRRLHVSEILLHEEQDKNSNSVLTGIISVFVVFAWFMVAITGNH